ncbi:benzoate/H(+) symporter BenE family transporter [Janthinobacterium fluminis]|uniref:Benzoate/H(+) symporter BenE family transporter n=1 Tax=Janthinobacterium fluminis TaxID=2987524 RepID=A0ABT5K427_9BURK|nr:benzoate/H(+) symporter BenE family transporter [Janthinobacterium fluminis]MDC8759644.1 benzoate/H(+) symporter BenE family transporter [Janthinobacterium fluminis]
MHIKDFSLSAVIAGFLAVFVGFAGPVAIVFQAAKLAGLPADVTSSWIWAISMGSGIAGLLLSWRLKMPVMAAWSTPGAALLVVSLPVVGIHQAVGAYIVAALLVLALGLSGAFKMLLAHLPKGMVAAMLAGVLFNFGVQAFVSIPGRPALVLSVLLAFLLAKRLAPRYATALAMLVGAVFVQASGDNHLGAVALSYATPVLIAPEWSWHAVLSVGFPLALVTLSGQHVPGLAVLQASGYQPPARPIVALTAFISLLFAPFGAHAVNPSVIAASICTGGEAHADPAKRYVAGIVAGLVYLVIAVFGGTLAQLMAALPKELVMTLAGLALVGSITSGLVGLVGNEEHRDASVITFLVAASGMSLLGLGAAFWSLVLGGAAYLILHQRWGVLARFSAARNGV